MVGELKVFVVMPAYNEAGHIADVIRAIPPLVDGIIVVDDASGDRTGDVVNQLQKQNLQLIRHGKNLGVGAATITGYRKALNEGADIVVKLDADGQMDPQQIAKLIRPLTAGSADYAKGFRFQDRKSIRRIPKLRLAGNLGLSYLVKMASGYWNIFDPTNGFTAIHKTALSMLNLDRISTGYYFETDMLCNLYQIQAVVEDVPLFTRYADEKSKLNPFKALLQFPGKLFCSFFRRIVWRYYVRDFSPFSLLFLTGSVLMLFGVVFGLIKWYHSASTGIPTPTGTVMLAVVPLFVGFQMFLQAIILDVNGVPSRPLQGRYTGRT
jgi:glycosyltransferase involved in cell wall biosynthesis